MASKLEEQAKLNKLLEDYDKLKEAGKEKEEGSIALLEKIRRLQDEANKSAADKLDFAQQELANAEENLRIMQEIADLNGDQEGVQDTLIAQSEKKLELTMAELKTKVEILKNSKDLTKEEKQQHADDIKALQARAQKEQEVLDLQNKQTEAYEGISGGVESTLNGIMGNIDAQSTFVGKLLLAKGHSGGISGAIGQVGKGLKKALNPANIMTGLLFKMQEATLALAFGPGGMDEWRAELAKSGGSLKEYGGLMEDVRASNEAAGVSMAQSMQAISALRETMSDFNGMAEKDKKALVGVTAIMGKLGVDAKTTGASFTLMNKAMGMGATEAKQATMEMAATANALGVSQQKMAADWAAASGPLSAHGKAGVKVFRELSTQAKATGLEVSDLMGIVGKMDTFEGAADAAGKLNAVLGSQLNSVDLLNASESERIRMLQDSVTASGKSWESMGKFERQSVMAAAGISDMATAGKLFGTTAQQMDKAAGAAEKMALADKELQKQALNATTAKEKITLLMERFGVIVTPLINIVHGLLDALMGFGPLVPLLVTLVGFALAYVKAVKMLAAVQTIWNSVKAVGITQTILGTGASAANTTADAANTVGKVANAAATTADTAASVANTTADAVNTAGKTVNAAATKTETLAATENTAAKTLNTAACGGNTECTKKGILVRIKEWLIAKKNSIMDKIRAMSIFKKTGATDLNTLSTKKGIFARLKDWALAIKMTITDKLRSLSIFKKTAATETNTAATNKGILARIKSWLIEKKNSIMDKIRSLSIFSKTAATETNTIATNKGIVARVKEWLQTKKNSIADKISTMWKGLTTVATEANTAATNKSIFARLKEWGLSVKQRIADKLSAYWTGIVTTAKWAYTAATNSQFVADVRANAVKAVGWVRDRLTALWQGILTLARWAGVGATVANTTAEGASIPVKIASTSATSAAVGPTLAFGAAMLMVGAGIFLAAYGLSLFVTAFAALSPAQIIVVSLALLIFLGAMIALAYLMTTVGAAAVGPMLAFGAAFLMIGLGVMLAALGLLLLVKAFGLLFNILVTNLEHIPAVALGMYMLGAAMIVLAAGMVVLGLATPWMLIAAGGLFWFSIAMASFGVAALIAGVGMKMLGDGFIAMKDNIIPVSEGMVIFGEALGMMGDAMLKIVFAMFGMIHALLAFVPAIIFVAYFGSPALMAFGMALFFMSIPMGLVTMMAPLFAARLQQVASTATTTAPALTALSQGFIMLAGALALFALTVFALPAIVLTFTILTGAILTLAAALSFIKTDDLRAVADMAKGIGSITVESAIAFGNAMTETKETVVALAKAPEAAKELTATTMAFAAPGAVTAGAPGAPGGAGAAGAAGGAAGGGERTIILKLNERELGRAVINIFEKEQNLNKIK
jgi:hypothetical protein